MLGGWREGEAWAGTEVVHYEEEDATAPTLWSVT